MWKNRTDLHSRLRGVAMINGVALPGHTLAFPKFYSVSIAHGALLKGREKWVNLYLPKGLALLKEAQASANHDISALGYQATLAMVEGYFDQFSRWPWPEPWPHDLARAAEEAEAAAPPEILKPLPRESPARAHRAKRASSDLQPDDYRKWRREVQFVVRARIMHERALAAREEYFCLSRAKTLPSTAAHLERLHAGLKALTRRVGKRGTGTVDRLIGASIADASQWRLDCLRWQLEVADMELLPLGSYLSGKSEPKQLGIWYVIDCRLRALLGGTLSEFAVSRIIAASLMVYAGQRLVPARNVDNFARNAVEKWRKRMRPDLAAETLERISIDGAVCKVSENANGQTVYRLVSQEPKQRVLWQLTTAAPSRRPSI